MTNTWLSNTGTWYPEAYIWLGLEHRSHSPYEKSIVERTIEFDDYYPCMGDGLFTLKHVHKWFIQFIFMHNKFIKSGIKFDHLRGRKLTEPIS